MSECPGFTGLESQNQFCIQESFGFEDSAPPDSVRTKLIRQFAFICGQQWYAGPHSDQGL